jgi:hypothetical protein
MVMLDTTQTLLPEQYGNKLAYRYKTSRNSAIVIANRRASTDETFTTAVSAYGTASFMMLFW